MEFDVIEIAASREKNNPLVVSRSHQIVHVYAGNSPASDLVILGNFEINLKDGSAVKLDFTARFVLATEQEDEGKVKFVEFWTDGSAMREAIEKANQTLKEKE